MQLVKDISLYAVVFIAVIIVYCFKTHVDAVKYRMAALSRVRGPTMLITDDVVGFRAFDLRAI